MKFFEQGKNKIIESNFTVKNILKTKRCMSNPLVYINEKSKNLFEDLPNKKKKRFVQKKEIKKK